MCDTIDIFCRSMKSDSDEWKRTEEFLINSKDKLFDSFCVEVFFNAFSDEKIHMIDNETLDTMLWKKVPRIKLGNKRTAGKLHMIIRKALSG